MSKTAFRNEKYEATGETKEWFGVTLHRIRAVADIAALGITIGTLGGWIEKPSNLDVSGDAWVFGNAQVFGDAQVFGNAWVFGNAQKTPITITGLRWVVTITDYQMSIGCHHHDLARWWKFSARQIAAMDSNATAFWDAHKASLQAICAASGRPFAKTEVEAA